MKELVSKLAAYAETLECEGELEMAADLDKASYLLDQTVDLRQVSIASLVRCHEGAIRQQMVQTSGQNREGFRLNLKREVMTNTAFIIKELGRASTDIQSLTEDDNLLAHRGAFLKMMTQIVLSELGGTYEAMA